MHNSRVTPGTEATDKRIASRQVRIYPRPYAMAQPVRSTKRPNYMPRRGKLVYIRPENPPENSQALIPKPVIITPRPDLQPTSEATREPHKKKRKLTSPLNAFVAVVIALALCTATFSLNKKPAAPILHAKPASIATNQARTVQQSSVVVANRSLPKYLKIPKINVDTQILFLGLDKTGNMAVPPDITNVGWYKYGAIPGNAGSAVIVGHLDGLAGQPGVFSGLSKLQPGDEVSVVDDKSQSATFVVRTLQTYAQTDNPRNVFTGVSGSHLNLITCTGTWDAAQHRYLQRLVVFTDKI